jgi:hypothetical protein
MKEEYRTTAQARFPYCKRHNRLYTHPVVGWLTPARPEDLNTFQALCDVCKEAACTSTQNSARSIVLAATMS